MTQHDMDKGPCACGAWHEHSVSTDLEEIECPICGYSANCLTDDSIDGTLVVGLTFRCNGCKLMLEVDAVDWEPTIYVKLQVG